MKRISIDKSSILLLCILGILAAMLVFLSFSLRSDAVDQALKSDRILDLAVVIEREGKARLDPALLLLSLQRPRRPPRRARRDRGS